MPRQASVRTDLEQGRAADAFSHWLAIGAAAGLASAKPETETITKQQARELALRSATALLPIAGRFGYCFEVEGEPALSVVMVVRDGFATTMATIASLRSGSGADIELILVDLGSDDETRSIGHYVPGARVLRFESDIGWSRAADAGRQLAGSPAVLFLSSEARLTPGAVERARARLEVDPSVGAVGGMLLQAHGVIAQAGGIVWSDGGIHDYMRGASPLIAEANFVRDVDFCGSGFLLVRAALLARLDGFDYDCAVGYEAVDLCLRIAEAGFRVVYDPSVSGCARRSVASRRSRRSFPGQARGGADGTPRTRRTGAGVRAPRRRHGARDRTPSYSVHRGHGAVATDRFGLCAIERSGPGDGVAGTCGDGVSGERL